MLLGYPVKRCLGTQNPLQNHLQKGAVSIRESKYFFVCFQGDFCCGFYCAGHPKDPKSGSKPLFLRGVTTQEVALSVVDSSNASVRDTEQIEIIAEDPTIDVYVQVQNRISCPFRFSDFYDSEFQDIRHFAKLVPLQAVYESMHGPASPDEVKVVHGNAVVVKPAHGAVPPRLAMQQP